MLKTSILTPLESGVSFNLEMSRTESYCTKKLCQEVTIDKLYPTMSHKSFLCFRLRLPLPLWIIYVVNLAFSKLKMEAKGAALLEKSSSSTLGERHQINQVSADEL